MTLLYRVFGIPRTIDEFLDKTERKGVRSASVYPAVKSSRWETSYSVWVYAEGITFEIGGVGKNVRKTKKTAMAKALEIAGSLESIGACTRINGTVPYPIAKKTKVAVPVI